MRIFLLLVLLLSGFSSFADQRTNNYELAAKAYAEGLENEAFIYLKKSLQENQQHLPSKMLLAKIYFSANNMPAAEHELNESLDLGADINLMLPTLGYTLLLQEKFTRLLELEQYAAQFSPNNQYEWLLLKGQVYLAESKLVLARAEFTQALALYPQRIRGLNILASLEIQQGDYAKAKTFLERSISINASNESTLSLYGEWAYAQGDYETAQAYFEQAYMQNEANPMVLRHLVMTELKLGDFEQMELYLKSVVEQTPYDPTALLANAALLAKGEQQQQLDEMLTELSQLIAAAEKNDRVDKEALLFIKGAAESIRGNNEKAQSLLRQYIQKRPEDISAIRLLSSIMLKQGQKYQLQILLKEYFDTVLLDDALAARLVYLYLGDKRMLAAERAYEQLRAAHPDSAYVHLLQAELYRAKGQLVEALKSVDALDIQLSSAPQDRLRLKAELLLALNQWQQAKPIVDELQTRSNLSPASRNLVAAYYLKTGDLTRAKQLLSALLGVAPTDLYAQYHFALVAKMEGDIQRAQTGLKQIIEAHPEHSESRLLLAQLYREQVEFALAEQQLNKILNYDQDNILVKRAQLSLAMQQEHWEQALKLVEYLNREEILNPQYLSAYVKVLIQLNRYADTAYPLGVLASLWSDDYQNLLQLAQLQLAAQQRDDAIGSLQAASKLVPGQLGANLTIAKIYLQQGEFKQAKQQLVVLEKDFAQHPEFIFVKAELELQSSASQALPYYYAVLDIRPLHQASNMRLFQLSLQGIEPDRFQAHSETTLGQSSGQWWLQRLLADSYLASKKEAQALPHYLKIIEQESLANDVSTLNNIALAYTTIDLAMAKPYAEKALAVGGNNPAILDTLGWVCALQTDYDTALAYLREAYSMNASDPSIRYHLGYVLDKLGRSSEAKQELQGALSLANDFADKAATEQLLEKLSQ